MEKVRTIKIDVGEFMQTILPKIRELLIFSDDEYLRFGNHCVQIENLKIEGLDDDNDPLRWMDFAGCDYLYRDGGTKGLSVRIQNTDKNWKTFTLRADTNKGVAVELQKKMIAYKSGSILPYLTVQAYVYNNKILGIGIVKTADLLEHCMGGGIFKNQINKIDETRFISIKWDDLKKSGYRVLEI